MGDNELCEQASVVLDVYKSRRPQASPLFRLVQDHRHRLQTVCDERFARIGREVCAHEYLLACSCMGRYVCPSCQAKRLAIWTPWLDTTLLTPVPHRQLVLTIPKRLRAYFLLRRRRRAAPPTTGRVHKKVQNHLLRRGRLPKQTLFQYQPHQVALLRSERHAYAEFAGARNN